MKSNPIKNGNRKCSNKKAKIHEKKEEIYIVIESNAPIDTPDKNKSKEKGNLKKEEKFLELSRTIEDKPIKNDIEEKDSNLNGMKEKHLNTLGKKRYKEYLSPRYPKYKKKSDHREKKRFKEFLNKYSTKGQRNNGSQKNFIQIINLPLYSYDKSNNNDTLSQSAEESNEIIKNIEEATPPRTFKIKDLSSFTFGKSKNSSNSNNKSRSKGCERFVAMLYIKENNFVPASGDVDISNYKGIGTDSQLSIKEKNPNN